MPPVAAEFAVGNRLDTGGLLARDGFADALVLHRAKRIDGDFAAFGFRAGLRELRRTQKAADVVGTKRRFDASAHSDSPRFSV